LGKQKLGSLDEEEAQNYLYHIFLLQGDEHMDKMQHGIWIKD